MFLFFGWLDFAKDYEKLQLTDVFFLFKEEILGNKAGWPNCIGDYLACGRPVMINPVGEVIDFAEEYPVAFIKTTTDENDISSKIQYMIKHITEIREKNVLIRRLAEEKFSWEIKSQELFNFYFYLLHINEKS
jgi:glycosyltransferase involved in cell wall biosynthesis